MKNIIVERKKPQHFFDNKHFLQIKFYLNVNFKIKLKSFQYSTANMKVVSIILIAAIIGLEYSTTLGAPLTKWFKTDNNTYYIETQEKVCNQF